VLGTGKLAGRGAGIGVQLDQAGPQCGDDGLPYDSPRQVHALLLVRQPELTAKILPLRSKIVGNCVGQTLIQTTNPA
jgi:hypothetical protein